MPDKNPEPLADIKALTNKICDEFFIDQMTPDSAAHHRTNIYKILLMHQATAAQQVVDYQREISRQIYVQGCRIASLESANEGRIF